MLDLYLCFWLWCSTRSHHSLAALKSICFEKGDSSELCGAKVGKDQAPVQVRPSGTRGTAS